MKKVFLGVVLLIAVLGYLFSRYWYFLPGIISSIVSPIQDNQAVTWQAGPTEPVAGERPPNIVLIVTDDLGFNDITFCFS